MDQTILIVEDDQDLAATLSDILAARGFTPLVVTHGHEALKLIKTEAPVVAVIDLKLEDISGIVVLKEIRRHRPKTECIVLTGYATQESAIEAVNLGAFAYLVKSYDTDQVLVTIQRAMEKHEAQTTIARLRRQNELILNAAGEGIVGLDANDRFTFVNPAAAEMLGFVIKDLINQSGHAVWHLAEAGTASPDCMQENCPVCAAHNRQTAYRQTDDVYWRRGNDCFPVEYVTTPLIVAGEFTGTVVVFNDITQRKKAEDALKTLNTILEERFHKLAKGAPVGIFRTDAAGNYLYVNDHWSTLTDLAADEAMGAGWQNGIHPADRTIVIEQWSRAVQNSQPFSLEYRFQRSDGVITWVFSQTLPETDAEEHTTGYIGTITNITDLKQTETALAAALQTEQEQRLRAETLSEATLALTSITNHQAVLDEILQQAKRLVPYAAASIMLVEDDDKLLFVRRKWDLSYQELVRVADSTQSLASLPLDAAVVQSQKAVVVPDTHQEPRWVIRKNSAWVRSHISVPLCHHHRVLGLLRIDGHIPQQFSIEDLHRLEPLANAAAIALENARLYEQAQQDAETKTLLLREVNHRVKNNLSAIIGLIYTEKKHAGIKESALYQSILNDLSNRVRGLATVHSLLSDSAWKPLRLSTLAYRVAQAALQALPGYWPIYVQVEPSPVKVEAHQANNLALIINELATNTAKYGVIGQKSTHININISTRNDYVLLEYRDDGPGYPTDVLQLETHNVGLLLTKSLVVEGLMGELSFKNDQGAVTTILFPGNQ